MEILIILFIQLDVHIVADGNFMDSDHIPPRAEKAATDNRPTRRVARGLGMLDGLVGSGDLMRSVHGG